MTDQEVEEWRDCHIDSRVKVSSLGRVRGVLGGIRALQPGRDGYPQLNIGGKARKVHRLVCIAFHGPAPTPGHEVAHGNGIRHDNRADNLRWATRSENTRDSVKHGTCAILRRTPEGLNCAAKLTWEQVDEIKNLYATGDYLQREIAAMFGVSKSIVQAINAGTRRATRPPPRPEVETTDAGTVRVEPVRAELAARRNEEPA